MVWWTQNLRFFRWSFVWRRSWNLRLRLHRRRQGELWQLLREVPSPVEERGSHRYRQRKAFSRRAFYHKQLDPLTRLIPGLAGAVGWKRAKPLPRRPRHRCHRQAQQKAVPGHSGHPKHADGGRRTHAGHEVVDCRASRVWRLQGSTGTDGTSGTSSSRDSSLVLFLIKTTTY